SPSSTERTRRTPVTPARHATPRARAVPGRELRRRPRSACVPVTGPGGPGAPSSAACVAPACRAAPDGTSGEIGTPTRGRHSHARSAARTADRGRNCRRQHAQIGYRAPETTQGADRVVGALRAGRAVSEGARDHRALDLLDRLRDL